MFDIIPFPWSGQENPEGWKAGWVILSAKFDLKNRAYPWYVTIWNMHSNEENHWRVPSIHDTWQYSHWAA